MVKPLWKVVWLFIKKKKKRIELQYDSPILLLGLLPLEDRVSKKCLNTYVHSNIIHKS